MPRDPNDQALHDLAPDFFAQKATEYGAANPDGLTDVEFKNVAREAFMQLSPWLHARANMQEGTAVDPTLLEDTVERSSFAKKNPGVTIDQRAAREFARLTYDDANPMARLNEDLLNARKVDAAWIEKYGNPNA